VNKEQSSYRQIMKATSLFGGVQVFTILISIIRSKFIAVLLGPAGMGIVGLLTATTGLIGTISGCGLSTSAVKNVSAANNTGNPLRIAIIVKVLRRLVWITGLAGSIITIVLSPLLSELTFGNKDYTLAFIWISVTILFNQLSAGQIVLLQGLRKLQFMAKASLSGSILGLVITVPLYYIWGIDGIVPAIIISSIINLLRSWYFARKVEVEPVRVTKVRTIAEGKGMLIMGLMISMSGMISMGASYIVRIFISSQGGVDQVGLYNAGFAIVNTYVGLIFTAMGTDYYPRLSAVAADKDLTRQTVNQQSEIATLILAPIIMVFLVFINWVVILLYSNKFVAVNDMIHWAALGMFFKAFGWSMGMILLAKGASKLFFWNELSASIYTLALNLLGYKLLGLTGLGISFALSYLIYSIQVYIISKIKYEFYFNSDFIKTAGIIILLAVACFLVVKTLSTTYASIAGSILILFTGAYSLKELDKKIGIKALIRTKLIKK